MMLRRTSPRVSANTAVLLLLFVVMLVLAGSVDARLARMAARAPRELVGFGQVVTGFGTSSYMFALSAAVGLTAWSARQGDLGRTRRLQLTLIMERAIYVFAALAAAGIGAEVIKVLVGRSRPRLLAEVGAFHFDPFSIQDLFVSFPSRHTANVFAAAVALSYIFPRARVALFIMASLIGASRVLVGAHYPSDVVGGAALGASVACLVARAFARRDIAFDSTAADLRVKQAEPS